MQFAEYVTEKRPVFVETSSYAKAAEDKTPWQARLHFNYAVASNGEGWPAMPIRSDTLDYSKIM